MTGTKFIQRVYGSWDLGLNYSNSSQNVQFNSNLSVGYRLPKLEFSITNYLNATNKYGDSTVSKKEDVDLTTLIFLKRSFFILTELGWQKNTELGLANRFLFNGAFGKTILADNHNRLRSAVGESMNLEKSIDGGDYIGNLDGLGVIQYKRFYNSTPKLSIDADYYIFPSLSDWGRVRMEFDLGIKVEIIKDFNVGLTGYYNYDSHPLEGASSKHDYGLNFTLGYQFGK